MKVCIVPGCPTLTTGTRCTVHARAADQQRGRRQQRGYGAEHDALRARWAPIVASGGVSCARCGRRITSSDVWHLDHDERRTGYLGPSHASCNTGAGGRAAHGLR